MEAADSDRPQVNTPQDQNVSSSRKPGLGPCTLSGSTFDGSPLHVELSSDCTVGHGASASIYKGKATGPSSWRQPLVVAVKVFARTLTPVDRELLLRELRAASQASLRHRQILTFLGTVDVKGQKSLVSLYMQKGNLLEYLKSHRVSDKTRLILQVAEAVTYMHYDVGLVHGDLKCTNVLISDSGDALLADFGLSTFVEKSQFSLTTMSGIRAMYTTRFAAPELLLGADDTSVRQRSKTPESDVYAFGMLVLEAVTELPPWSGLNTLAVIKQVCQGQHPQQPTSQGLVSMSHAWWDVCKQSWRRQPGHRPSIRAVLKALRDGVLNPHRRLTGHSGSVLSLAYFPRGQKFASASFDGSIRIWNSSRGDLSIAPLRGHIAYVTCVAVSPNGFHLCSGGTDWTVRRWNTLHDVPVGEPMTGHRGIVNCVAFSPDGKRIASGGDDNMVRLWDASTGEPIGRLLAGHESWVRSVAFSPDGACIASGSYDRTIRVWDTGTGSVVGTLKHDAPVFSVFFSPDRLHLVSGDAAGRVQIWNVSTRQLELQITGHSSRVVSVAVSPNGTYIASASNDRTIRIWNVLTGDAVGAPLRGHTHSVRSVAFAPDGRSLVSCALDQTVGVWDLFE